jgi:hypothetical protein
MDERRFAGMGFTSASLLARSRHEVDERRGSGTALGQRAAGDGEVGWTRADAEQDFRLEAIYPMDGTELE